MPPITREKTNRNMTVIYPAPERLSFFLPIGLTRICLYLEAEIEYSFSMVSLVYTTQLRALAPLYTITGARRRCHCRVLTIYLQDLSISSEASVSRKETLLRVLIN